MQATLEEVLAVYRERLEVHRSGQHALERKQRTLGAVLVAVLAAIVLLSRMAFTGVGPAWAVLLAVVVEGALLWGYVRRRERWDRIQRLIVHTEGAIRRADGTAPQSGRTGEEMRAEFAAKCEGGEHLYEKDLNVLGPDSLFGLLDTVRTGLGERGLAKYLLEPAQGETTAARYKDVLERQEAVRELRDNVELREKIAAMGTSSFQQVPANFFDEWLAVPAAAISAAYGLALLLTALLLGGMLAAGFAHVVTFGILLPNVLLAAALQIVLCWRLRERLKPILEFTGRLSNHVELVSQGLALLAKESFYSAKLKKLAEQVKSPVNAVPQLKRLQNSVATIQQREQMYFMALSLLFALGTQAALSIARWKRKNAEALAAWLEAWAEFEALNALAAYAFEHPENAFPKILPASHAPVFESAAMGHPLMPRDGCVLNDVSLDGSRALAYRFYVISGSNMSGKSTLLRTIGLNAVLAYAGAPVRAKTMRITPLTIGSSLSMVDSLADGKSKFLAEGARLAAIVRRSNEGPVLFLIDELFSGTNSNDRRTAAEAAIRKLLRNGAIGALATHDLALTSLATEGNRGLNLHMASPDERDPLGVDFKLKPGVVGSSNALAILRILGL
jgi:ABC-type multidrug transport system fused ATPase/permease subunit